MSNNNYDYTSIYISICIGLLLTIVVVIIWIYWAYNTYRYSSDRLSGPILNKYQAIPAHRNALNDTLTYDVSNIIVSDDKTFVTAVVHLQDKRTKAIKSSDNVKYSLSEDCAITDLQCIAV